MSFPGCLKVFALFVTAASVSASCLEMSAQALANAQSSSTWTSFGGVALAAEGTTNGGGSVDQSSALLNYETGILTLGNGANFRVCNCVNTWPTASQTPACYWLNGGDTCTLAVDVNSYANDGVNFYPC
ncbi:hypothetical protein V8E54_000605 [Elaphomyces granulatus]|jgi:hypothetical protein